MSVLFGLTQEKSDKIKIYSPSPRAVLQLNNRQIISGMIHVIKRDLLCSYVPKAYGMCTTFYKCFIRWSRKGTFSRIMSRTDESDTKPGGSMIDATDLKIHRTVASLSKKGNEDRQIGRTKGEV